jgi:lipoic acid synthetase
MDVFAHNIETVRRLTSKVRDPRSGYVRSLDILEAAKAIRPRLVTKSSIMVGLGESREEVVETMRDLRRVGVDVLTVGQYLRPSVKHLPVVEFVRPEVFKEYEQLGLEAGFTAVASGPLVRSSYRAGEYFVKNIIQNATSEDFV